MKKHIKYIICALCIVHCALFVSCSRIRYEEDENGAEAPRPVPVRERPEYNDHRSLFFNITRRTHYETLQIENITSYVNLSELPGFHGRGYILIDENRTADFELNVPSTQHYSIGLRAVSAAEEDAVAVLAAAGVQQGAYYVRVSEGFSEYWLHGIYLEAGVNRLSLTALKGSVYADELIIRDFELPEARFSTSRLPANPDASNQVRLLMDYLGETFGQRVLLAQHVTAGTNTEIGAIYEATGRLPAIRVSDLSAYSRSFPSSDERPQKDDIELALEWAANGGIVSYDWTWFSPAMGIGSRSHYFAEESDFDLDAAFTGVYIADLDAEGVRALFEAGAVSRSCYELVLELDYMAEHLKRLRDANVPVLWRPLHQAGTRWFWWGDCEPESFKWLWRLMFERFSEYHGLNNLIWVWSGQSADYYPGDEFVDIIGEDFYNIDDTSGLPQLAGTADYSVQQGRSGRRRMAAMTECALLPSPDLMNRDNALWLWVALYRGDFLVDSRGRLNEQLNTRERLERAYNHELTITLDKLPEEF
jgi:mannan endo-1,4-beta-mannosidase